MAVEDWNPSKIILSELHLGQLNSVLVELFGESSLYVSGTEIFALHNSSISFLVIFGLFFLYCGKAILVFIRNSRSSLQGTLSLGSLL